MTDPFTPEEIEEVRDWACRQTGSISTRTRYVQRLLASYDAEVAAHAETKGRLERYERELSAFYDELGEPTFEEAMTWLKDSLRMAEDHESCGP